MWNALLSVGDAYAEKCLLRATGVRAAWRLLMPADAMVWFEAQQWSDAELARVGKQWGQVWWRYLRSLCGAQHAPATPKATVCLAEAGFALLRTDARARSTFAAILLQLASQGRHDQSVCSLRADPLAPPFYDLYVSRSHTASVLSLRGLMKCEHAYACAKRAVDKFRDVQGRVVAEIAQGEGVNFMRRPRSKLKRFKCAACTKHVKSRCRKCTRLQPQNTHGLVEYWGHHHQWVPAPDVHTVCSDVVFVPAQKLTPGTRVVHNGLPYTVRDVEITKDVSADSLKEKKIVRLRLQSWSAEKNIAVPRNSMLAVRRREEGFQMLRDTPELVHTMRVSVNLDDAWRKRAPRPPPTLSPHRLAPLRVTSPTAAEEVWSYAVWRSLAGAACSANQTIGAVVEKNYTHVVCHPAGYKRVSI